MVKYGIKIFIALVLLTFSVGALAAQKQNVSQYFCVLKKIQQLPDNAQAINPVKTAELNRVLSLLKHQSVSLPFANNSSESLQLYVGDFDNTGDKEYLFIVTGGSMNTNTVAAVFKNIRNQFRAVDFNKIVTKNLFPGSDMGPNFHLWIAKPFAYVKNGMTYLRFMDYPGSHTDYDVHKLHVTTYYWRDQSFRRVAQLNGVQLLPCR